MRRTIDRETWPNACRHTDSRPCAAGAPCVGADCPCAEDCPEGYAHVGEGSTVTAHAGGVFTVSPELADAAQACEDEAPAEINVDALKVALCVLYEYALSLERQLGVPGVDVPDPAMDRASLLIQRMYPHR